jgi:hypothetical protein
MSEADHSLPLRGTGDLRIAIVVDPALGAGLLANTVAVIAAGIGAARPAIGGVRLTDATGRAIWNSADRPIAVLQADKARLADLLLRAEAAPPDATVVAFPAFARSIHGFEDYAALFPLRTLATEDLEGIGLCGPERWVRSLTGSFKLLR